MLLKFQDCLSYTLEKFKASKAKGLLVYIDDTKESLSLISKYKGKVLLNKNPSIEIVDFANGASISGRQSLTIVHSNGKHNEIISNIVNLSKSLHETSFKHICVLIDNEFSDLDLSNIDPSIKFNVFLPSNPYDFCSYIKDTLESNNPSFFLVSPDIFEVEGPVPNFSKDLENSDLISNKKAEIRKEANQITLISTGEDIFESCEYANKLNLDAEIIETRVIMPLDYETLQNSIAKTKCAKIIQSNNYLNQFNKILCENLKAFCNKQKIEADISIERIENS